KLKFFTHDEPMATSAVQEQDIPGPSHVRTPSPLSPASSVIGSSRTLCKRAITTPVAQTYRKPVHVLRNIQDRNKLEAEAADTADLILFLDSLFDCLNSSSKVAPKKQAIKKEPEIFRMWLNNIKPPNYENLTTLEIYNKYYVCEKHFSNDCIVAGTRRGLKRTAVPTLHIPGLEIRGTEENFPTKKARTEHIGIIHLRLKLKFFTHDEPMATSAVQEQDIPGPSHVRTPSPLSPASSVIGSSRTLCKRAITTPVAQTYRKPVHVLRSVRKRKLILREVNVSRAVDLTPKARKLYRIVTDWGVKMARMQRNVSSFQSRLAIAEKCVNSPDFKKIFKQVNESMSKDIQDRNKLEAEAADTADLILFLDSLFDCLNSSSKVAPKSKLLKGGITENSPHEEFLKKALGVLRSMKFFCPKKQHFVSTPSIDNMIFTIQGVLYLKDILLNDKNFSYVLTRSLNQDPLEECQFIL
ncbi:hypothetical protein NQ317_003069, partial [Molorchus minor]